MRGVGRSKLPEPTIIPSQNEEQLAFVVILHLSEGVNGLAQGSITFSGTRRLTDDELVMMT